MTYHRLAQIRCAHLNINHAINKLTDIASVLFSSGMNLYILGLSESRLSSHISDTDISMPGYNIVRMDPKQQRKRGLVIYIQDTLTFKRLHHLEHVVETVWINRVKLKKGVTTSTWFRLQKSSRTCWLDGYFISMMEAVCLGSQEIILLGDFNIDLFEPNKSWLQMLENYHLYSFHHL